MVCPVLIDYLKEMHKNFLIDFVSKRSLNRAQAPSKGLIHDWGQCLSTKNTLHEIPI